MCNVDEKSANFNNLSHLKSNLATESSSAELQYNTCLDY